MLKFLEKPIYQVKNICLLLLTEAKSCCGTTPRLLVEEVATDLCGNVVFFVLQILPKFRLLSFQSAEPGVPWVVLWLHANIDLIINIIIMSTATKAITDH